MYLCHSSQGWISQGCFRGTVPFWWTVSRGDWIPIPYPPGTLWKILEVSSLKEGSGRELRYLHDVVQQNLCALKSMDYEPSRPFITSVLKLKFDQNTTFEWQKHSQGTTDVPYYRELLEFINMRTQAESCLRRPQDWVWEWRAEESWFQQTCHYIHCKRTAENCVLCKNSKHSLYMPAASSSLYLTRERRPP